MSKDRTPEFNGSMQYIETCGDLIKSYHDLMVTKNYSLAVSVLQEIYSELLPYVGEESEKISKMEKDAVNEVKSKGSINIFKLHTWYRKMNIIYHQTGLGMKTKPIKEDEWEI